MLIPNSIFGIFLISLLRKVLTFPFLILHKKELARPKNIVDEDIYHETNITVFGMIRFLLTTLFIGIIAFIPKGSTINFLFFKADLGNQSPNLFFPLLFISLIIYQHRKSNNFKKMIFIGLSIFFSFTLNLGLLFYLSFNVLLGKLEIYLLKKYYKKKKG